MDKERSRLHALARVLARASLVACAAVTMTATLTLAGCGQKGPLYLPNQKKTKVPPSTGATPAPAPAPAPANSTAPANPTSPATPR